MRAGAVQLWKACMLGRCHPDRTSRGARATKLPNQALHPTVLRPSRRKPALRPLLRG